MQPCDSQLKRQKCIAYKDKSAKSNIKQTEKKTFTAHITDTFQRLKRLRFSYNNSN